jgi:hypothetical protein
MHKDGKCLHFRGSVEITTAHVEIRRQDVRISAASSVSVDQDVSLCENSSRVALWLLVFLVVAQEIVPPRLCPHNTEL